MWRIVRPREDTVRDTYRGVWHARGCTHAITAVPPLFPSEIALDVLAIPRSRVGDLLAVCVEHEEKTPVTRYH
jgi:hypothetical protein